MESSSVPATPSPTSTSRSTLIVTSHPDRDSVTWRLTRSLIDGIRDEGGKPIVHDLVESGFSPVFTAGDLAAFRGTSPVPDDVRAEQHLIESVDDIVLVFPVYWWSPPALIAGWIERVFTNEWAYTEREDASDFRSRVPGLHIVGVAGVNEGTFRRRGYWDGLSTRMIYGIVGYSGIERSSLNVLFDSHDADAEVHAQRDAQAADIGRQIAAGVRQTVRTGA